MREVMLSEKFKIKAELKEVGEDLLVLVTGGNKPHIGAISAGIDHLDGAADEAGFEKSSEPGQLLKFPLPTHRDNFLSDPIAETLSKKLKKNVIVLAGVHLDGIKKEEIEEIVSLVPKMIEKIIDNYCLKSI